MKEPKKKPVPQAYNFELSAIGDLKLERETPEPEGKPLPPSQKEVNEDMIQRLINCVKKI